MNKIYKTLLTILATVVLGAVGSGVWQYVLDPVLKGGTNFMLELATLGVESYKNDIYIEVSKGYQELASHRMQSLFNVLIAMMCLVLSCSLVVSVKSIVKDHKGLLEEVESMETGSIREYEAPDIAKIKSRLSEQHPRKTLKLAYFTVVLSGVFAIMLTILTSSDRYINSAVTHYYQTQRIAAPYMTIEENMEIDSRFSQISSDEDYRQVLAELYSVTEEEGITLVNFEVW